MRETENGIAVILAAVYFGDLTSLEASEMLDITPEAVIAKIGHIASMEDGFKEALETIYRLEMGEEV